MSQTTQFFSQNHSEVITLIIAKSDEIEIEVMQEKVKIVKTVKTSRQKFSGQKTKVSGEEKE